MKHKARNKMAGVTLLEFLVVMAVFGIVIGAIYSIFVSQREAYDVEDQRLEMEQNARAVTNMVVRELRMAGYHALDPEFVNNLDVWVPTGWEPTDPMEVTLDSNPKVTLAGGAEPDMITFLAVLESDHNPTTLTAGASEGDITINVNDSTDIAVGDMIHIGVTSDTAKVRATGNTLTIDTDPTLAGNQGLTDDYPAGTEVGEIFLVTYTVFNELNDGDYSHHSEGHPFLMRKLNNEPWAVMAENITDMQVSTAAGVGGLELNLEAQPEKEGTGYGSEGENPTIAVAVRVDIRNVNDVGTGSTCAVPGAPTGLDAEGLDAVYPCQVHAWWNEVTTDEDGNAFEEGCEVDGYKIYFDTDPGIMANGVGVGDTTDTVGDVTDYHTCTMYAQVAAHNSAGYGDRSGIVSVTDVTAPAQPQNLTASNAFGDQQIGLAWTLGSDCDLDGYHVLRADAGSTDYTKINRVILRGIAHYTDWEVIGCKQYQYSVVGVDYCPNTSTPATPTDPIAPTDSTAPLPPSDLSASYSGGDVTLTWTLSGDDGDGFHDVKHYYIYGDGSHQETVNGGTNSVTFENDWTTYQISAVDYCYNESPLVAVGDTTTTTSTSSTTTTTTTTTSEPNEPREPDIENITQDPDGIVVPKNASVEICAEISDYSGIVSAILHSNWHGDIAMTPVSVDGDGNGLYCTTLSKQNNRTVTYYIKAVDGIGLEAVSDPAYYDQSG